MLLNNTVHDLEPNWEIIFEKIFKAHFNPLTNYAFTILNDFDNAEEIVQNVFLKIWEKRGKLPANISVKAYLYKAVHNESLNWIRHHKVKDNYQKHFLYEMKDVYESPLTFTKSKELEKQIQKALNDLPEQCKLIFQMSRFEDLKYREIADVLGISIKTVENQMGKALKIMRVKLIDFLPAIVWLFNYTKFWK